MSKQKRNRGSMHAGKEHTVDGRVFFPVQSGFWGLLISLTERPEYRNALGMSFPHQLTSSVQMGRKGIFEYFHLNVKHLKPTWENR